VKKNKKKNSAFTLIEILVAVCIFAVIVVGLGATLNSGLKLWKKANESGYEEINFLLEIEKLNRNIREVFVIEGIPIIGNSVNLEIPVLEGAMIFRNHYSFDAATKKLTLEKTTYESILADKSEVYSKKDCFEAHSLLFSYLVFDPEQEIYLWQEEVNEETLSPIAIKIKITLDTKETEQIVFIPIYFYD
jgi:prepilin-type N-terminal cleavage/methylation domain-containing protein